MSERSGLFLDGVFYDSFATVTVAAGADLAVTLPDNMRCQLLSVRVTLVTSADVANRRMQVVFRRGSDATYDWVAMRSGFVQPASTTYRYFFTPGQAEDTALVDADYVLCRMPFPVELRGTGSAASGWSIRTDIINLDNTDQITAFAIYGRSVGQFTL